MTPVPWSLTGRESLLAVMARKLGRSRLITKAVIAVVFRFLLVLAGLGLLTAAAWTASVIAGLAVAGVSCLLLEWIVKR